MSRKKTQEEIESILLNEFNNEYVILDKYIDNKTKVRFKHNIENCNHVWECVPYSIINMKQGCPKCKITKLKKIFSFDISHIKNQIDSEYGYKLLSNNYENAKTILQIQCPNNHIFKKTWNKWQQGEKCPLCKRNEISQKQKYPLEELLNSLHEDGMEILEWVDEYKNRNSKFVLECKNGHIEERTVGAYLNNKKRRNAICPKCSFENMSAMHHGENHHAWRGGTTELHSYLRKIIKPWKLKSMEKCNYKCIITGAKNFEIHHIYSFKNIVDDAFDILNMKKLENTNDYSENDLSVMSCKILELHEIHGFGVCLREDLHKLFHNKYGYGDNNAEQFEEFKRELIL